MTPTRRGPLVVGFDIGGTNIRGLLIDGQGHILRSDQLDRPDDADGIVDAVIAAVRRLEAAENATAEAVGVGCAGTVDRRGVVRQSPNIACLVEFPLAGRLASQLGLPVVADNDATTATWAEVKTGAARGTENVAFVALGTGIGCGLVLDGELRRGAQGFAGEAGHMIVQAGGPRCPCGRDGCWEMFASGGALGRMAKKAAIEGRAPTLVEAAGGDPEAVRGEHVTSLVAQGDETALGLLDELGWWVGLGLNNLVNICDVSTVVIGGGLSETGPALITAIHKGFVESMVDHLHRPPVNIVNALHGGRAGAIGAALLAAERIGANAPWV